VRFVVDKVALGQVFLELSVFPCQFHSTGAALLVQLCKKTAHPHLHLHHRGWTINLKAAVRPQHQLRGPLTTKKKKPLFRGFLKVIWAKVCMEPRDRP
jgi:hypothetical protein